ncbi:MULTISPECIES: GspH/FimT family protein [Acinetobacter]|uniref:Type II secretion system protein H n=1 Tax=Acinetobacter genomosp. 15BJ TaxID=106651 RepID=A0ABT8UWW2_9GAMM|nr:MULTISPECIES: GspH/FimT family pseudopilin [Acinetobacter]MCI3879176.1 GspH/FimT family pseudopilin [Acinetobacter higginsii]MDO3657525.1 GspH/FimT family pseudopilin [Acinetobacter genomosp. 15BJ]
MFKFHGLTLIELLTTLGILAILTTFAVPYFREIMISNEVAHLKRILTIHIQKAKTDAQLHHKNVMLCPSSDAIHCDHDWNKGFIGFIDSNRNRQRDLEETLLFTIALNHKYGHLSYRAFGNIPDSIIFQSSNGLPLASNGSFIYCSTSPNYHTKILLSRMGNIRFEKLSHC